MTTAIQSVDGSYAHTVSFGTTTYSPPPVMPEPQSPDMGGDMMSMIYSLMSKQRNTDVASGENAVSHHRELEKSEQLKQQVAFKKQEDAEQNAASWGLVGKIASVVAIAVSAVVSALSCGAASGLCVAACVISSIAFAEGEAHVLTTLTGNADVDKAFQIGSGIAAAICSGGAGFANLGATVVKTVSATMQIAASACEIGQEALSCSSDKGCQDVAMGLGIAGSAFALAGSLTNIGSAATQVADAGEKIVTATGDAVKGAGEIGTGVATIVSTEYKADATDRATDAKQAQIQITHLERLTEWVIDGVKETDASHKRALQTLQEAITTKAQTLIIASAKA